MIRNLASPRRLDVMPGFAKSRYGSVWVARQRGHGRQVIGVPPEEPPQKDYPVLDIEAAMIAAKAWCDRQVQPTKEDLAVRASLKEKQPFFIRPKGGEGIFVFAGLYSTWTGPEGDLPTCTIITTTPNDLVAGIHDRMPVILAAGDQDAWLDPDNNQGHTPPPALST